MAEPNDRTVVVYALYANSDRRIRYVGQTTMGVENRARKHVARALNGSKKPTHREAWIRKVVRDGDTIGCAVLQDNAVWNSDEISWIRKLTDSGADLVNATTGGEGCMDAPQELRSRIGISVAGLWEDPAYKLRQSEAHKGKPWSAERRAACEAVSAEVRSDRARRGRMKMSPGRRSELAAAAARAGIAKRRSGA